MAVSAFRALHSSFLARKRSGAVTVLALVLALLCAGAGISRPAAAQGHSEVVPNSVDPLLRVVPLDPQRVSPLMKDPLPHIPVVTGTVNYLLYHRVRPSEVPILHLRIPEKLVGRVLSDPYRAWDLWLVVRYMGPHRELEPAGEELFSCRSNCVDRLSIIAHSALGNIRGCREAMLKGMMDNKAEEQVDPPPSSDITWTEEVGAGGMVIYRRKVNGTSFRSVMDYDWYVKKNISGKVELIAKCSPHAPYPHCDAYTVVGGQREQICIDYSFDQKHLPEWMDLEATVQENFAAFIVGTIEPAAENARQPIP